jgi:hypothetical protein
VDVSKIIASAVTFLAIGVAFAPAVSRADGDAGQASAEKLEKVFPDARPYSPYADRNFPTRPLFGDTHLHTGASFDAGAFGARLTPRDAFRFARGDQLISSTGQPAKLSRPLDFMVITDHSDNMGMFTDLFAGKPEVLADPQARTWFDMIKSGQGAVAAFQIIQAFGTGTLPQSMIYGPDTKPYKSAWLDTIASAEEFNLHRNVIFRDNGEKASQVVPYTTLKPMGSDNPRDLWTWMQGYEDRTGGDVLAIAHNGNLSNGRMFETVDSFSGKPIDRAYAETRAKWERIYEATQIKGDGEAHPFLSPNDEFADFETWDWGNLDLSVAKTKEMLQYEYARSALKLGLKLEGELGVNPFKFGMVGSTDAHTGLAAVEEDNYFGKTSSMEPSPDRYTRVFVEGKAATVFEWETVAGGYAAVWAQENTRAAIFDAMERRETYSTTGTRMAVRFFGGWDFTAADAVTRSPAVAGYSKGVPMGGDLGAAKEGTAPTFLVAALKDPIGANLDRYQIVKGWVDAQGELQEKVYDVVWSGDRQPGADGKLPPVGNTVDAAEAVWTNTIGSPELIAVWTDPDFDPKLRAFYYGRVLEIPTPRWTTYDAKYFGLKPNPEIPTSIQERAYTSPIWYTPAGG